MVETGRHMKIPKSERFCPNCDKLIEDEIHFVTRCKTYNDLRTELYHLCIKLNPNFSYYTDHEKFVFIMANDNLCVQASKFIHEATGRRECLLNIIS